MAAKRKNDRGQEASKAATKLNRLLETENELEAMLKDVRREAKELVAAARASASAQLERFESELEAGDGELQRRIARGRDKQIESIREEARKETERLAELDDERVTELAEYVLDLIMNRPGSGGSA